MDDNNKPNKNRLERLAQGFDFDLDFKKPNYDDSYELNNKAYDDLINEFNYN